MATSRAFAPSSRNFERSSQLLLASLCAAAIAARAWLQFGTPLTPGMNGAYYFVQARALLEHGRLAIPDLPLTFWLQAGLARFVAALTGWPQDDAIVFAVKLADAVLPPLVAWPVAWLGARWQFADDRSPSRLAMLAPAAIVCASAAPLSMTGDFQKNSLALVWLAATAWTAHRFLTAPDRPRAAAIVPCLVLLGLTHIGVLGAAIVFLFGLTGAAVATATPVVRGRVLRVLAAGVVALGAAALITYRHDPARVQRLARVFSEPSSVLADAARPDRPPGFDGQPPLDQPPDFPPGAPADGAPRLDSAGPLRPPGGPGADPFMPGVPGSLGGVPRWLFLSVGLGALALALWRRPRLPAADFVLAIAAGITAAGLGGGFFEPQKAQRLMLIAVVPAAMAASFLLAQIPRRFPRGLIGSVVLFSAVASGALYAAGGGRPIITVAHRDELRSLAPLIAAPERTLIVAPHGLEWWTAWTLRTHIAQPSAVSREDWARYDQVLYLSEKGGTPRHGGPGLPPRFGPPGARPNATPEDAVRLHDGALFTLSRVDRAPADQPTDAEVAAHRRARR